MYPAPARYKLKMYPRYKLKMHTAPPGTNQKCTPRRPGTTILIDGRVIAAYSRGKIVLPKLNMLDETRRSRGHLSYSIKGELFGEDYRQ
jgi:hypothetical protein